YAATSSLRLCWSSGIACSTGWLANVMNSPSSELAPAQSGDDQKAVGLWTKVNSLGFFAAMSAAAALSNVWIASRQAAIAETQLTINQLAYRPQLAIDVGGVGFTSEQGIGANVTFKNVGTIGIFEAGLSAGGAV